MDSIEILKESMVWPGLACNITSAIDQKVPNGCLIIVPRLWKDAGWKEQVKARSRQGKARQGKARQGKARQGKARQGKATRSMPEAAFAHSPSGDGGGAFAARAVAARELCIR